MNQTHNITSHHITFISPRIYKSSSLANFSEKENNNEIKTNKIVYYIQYIALLFM